MATSPDPLFGRLAAAEDDPAALTPLLAEIAVLPSNSFELNHCIHILASSPVMATVAFGTWFGRTVAAQVGKAIEHELSVTHLQAETLPPFEPGRIDPVDALLAAHRLVGIHAAPAVSLGWIVACLQAGLDPSEATLGPLLRHMARQFPDTTRQLLNGADPALTDRYPALAETIRASNALYEHRAQAPRLKEFTLSVEDRIIRQGRQLQEQRDIEQRAEEASVFTQIVTRAHFKYAQQAAFQFETGGETYEQVVSMQEFSLIYERPFLERTDPFGAEGIRNRLVEGMSP